MISIIKKTVDKIQTKFINYNNERQYKFVKNHFCLQTNPLLRDSEKRTIVNHECFVQNMIYKDEAWNYIKNLYEYRTHMQHGEILKYEDNRCIGESYKYSIFENRIIVNTDKLFDNWLCFYLDKEVKYNYNMQFNIVLFSEFTEVQIAFRYKDLGNRYRFMLKNNREIVFECAYQGEFFHGLWSKPYEMELGIKHHIELKVFKEIFEFYIDGVLLMAIREKKSLFEGDGLAIILWNIDDKSDIQCEISDFRLCQLSNEE